MYLVCEVVHDGETYPAGHDVRDWPEGTITSLRGINLLADDRPGSAPKSQPKPQTASDGGGTTTTQTATAGGDDRLPDGKPVTELLELGVAQKSIDFLLAAELKTVGDLRAYAAANGKFEPLTGIGRTVSKTLLALIA